MKRFGLVGLIVLLSLSAAQIGLAQSELVLSINRDFGYGGFDSKIEGLFSLHANGPENLVNVEFFIDETSIALSKTGHSKFSFPQMISRRVSTGFTRSA